MSGPTLSKIGRSVYNDIFINLEASPQFLTSTKWYIHQFRCIIKLLYVDTMTRSSISCCQRYDLANLHHQSIDRVHSTLPTYRHNFRQCGTRPSKKHEIIIKNTMQTVEFLGARSLSTLWLSRQFRYVGTNRLCARYKLWARWINSGNAQYIAGVNYANAGYSTCVSLFLGAHVGLKKLRSSDMKRWDGSRQCKMRSIHQNRTVFLCNTCKS